MEVRSYYASTLEAAMALARRELGPEALLIQSQRTSPEWMHLGKYEAVFAGEIIAKPAKPAAAPSLPIPKPANPKATPVDLVGRSDFRDRLRASSPSRRVPTAEPVPISCDPGLGLKGFAATVALIGPAGAGKTTTAMKIALRSGILESRTVRLIAFDPYRVGATRQMRHFADLFNLSFTDCELITQLQTALAAGMGDGGPEAALTLIDTPGFSSKQVGESEQLAACLRLFPEIESQLVLRLDRKLPDNLNAVDLFSSFMANRLILTALDDTSELADVPALIARANKPVSYLGTGQNLVEDFESASPRRLHEILLNGWPKAASAAA
jgi:flagellar biosynthesis GTPase FlhF